MGHEHVDADSEGEDELRGDVRILLLRREWGGRGGIGEVIKHTQSLLTFGCISRKIIQNAAQNAANIPSKPTINLAMLLAGMRFPSALLLRNPGNASRSMA